MGMAEDISGELFDGEAMMFENGVSTVLEEAAGRIQAIGIRLCVQGGG